MSEQGPYTVDGSGHWVMTSIPIYQEVWYFDRPEQAKMLCRELNAAFAAGRLSASEQGKELTEKEIDRIWKMLWDADLAVRWEKGRNGAEASPGWFVGAALRYVRDNGYLSKTAGEQPSQSSTEGLGVPGAEPPVGLSEGSVPSGPADAASPIPHAPSRKPKLGEVWEVGEKRFVVKPEHIERMAVGLSAYTFVCDRAHADGRYDYECGSYHCRCKQ